MNALLNFKGLYGDDKVISLPEKQSLVQKSSLQIVQEYLVGEAKKYLLNTNYSISEIAYFLDFQDPAYFTRLFKKKTGQSPSEFRGNIEKK